jgi:hypothetical protein
VPHAARGQQQRGQRPARTAAHDDDGDARFETSDDDDDGRWMMILFAANGSNDHHGLFARRRDVQIFAVLVHDAMVVVAAQIRRRSRRVHVPR